MLSRKKITTTGCLIVCGKPYNIELMGGSPSYFAMCYVKRRSILTKHIIGIDPDSKAHGVALYTNRALVHLECMTLMQIFDMLQTLTGGVVVHMENVKANNARFGKSFVANARAAGNVHRSIGMVQQAQTELERLLEYMGVEYVHHKISKQWKDAKIGKKLFEQTTGWKGRSNEDTRSAAFFAYKHICK